MRVLTCAHGQGPSQLFWDEQQTGPSAARASSFKSERAEACLASCPREAESGRSNISQSAVCDRLSFTHAMSKMELTRTSNLVREEICARAKDGGQSRASDVR